MNQKQIIAGELLKMARSMVASDDLGDILEIIPEMQEKQAEIAKKRDEFQQQINKLSYEASKEVAERSKALLKEIEVALVRTIKSAGLKVSGVDNSGTLLEVYVSEGRDAKVSVHLSLTVGSERANYMIRDEELNALEGRLDDNNTVNALVKKVKGAIDSGFFGNSAQE